jgi:hypothetical protein
MYWPNLIDEIGATSEENRLNTAGFMERHIKIQGSCIYPQFSYYWYYSFTSKDRDVEGIFERFTSGGGGGITWKRANCASAEGTSFVRGSGGKF